MDRLYANENFPLPVVERVRVLGHDVLTIQEIGKADIRPANAAGPHVHPGSGGQRLPLRPVH